MRTNEFLSDLKIEFREWRRRKRSRTEPIPEALLAKAKAAAAQYGRGRVGSALRIETKHLKQQSKAPVKAVTARHGVDRVAKVRIEPPATVVTTPTFSKIHVQIPRGPQPMIEAETPAGVKLRVFAVTPETVGVLSSFCRTGGGL